MRILGGQVFLLALLLACRSNSDLGHPASSRSTMAKSLDSCNAISSARRVVGAQEPVVNPQAGAWSSGRMQDFRGFALFVPDSARIKTDSVTGAVSLSWQGCATCRLSIAVQVDSAGDGIDGRVARLVSAQRVIDSVNHDPHTSVFQFDDIDGPPQPFTAAAGRGFLIEESCGDCAAETLLFGRRGYVAVLGFGTDDDEPQGMRRMCQMAVVGKTFQWR